jgi:GntR family transcriptional regulator, transcriptional repressor for pyruvate dehydrogenase complex
VSEGAANGFAEPIRTPPTFEAAVNEILASIERARLRRGGRLPNEPELAQQLAISKPTLRQALRVLQRAEVIDVRAGKGGGIFLVSELLPYAAVAGHVALETNVVVDIFSGRRVLERAVTHAAATTATKDDYAEMERINRLIAKYRRDPGAVGRADAMLHLAVARSTGNRLLEDGMRLVARQMAPLRDMLTTTDEDIALILDIHARQIQAMRTLETAQLEEVLDEHFRILEERFAHSLGQSWEVMFGARRRTPPFEPPWRKLASLDGGYQAYAWAARAGERAGAS